MMYTKGMQISTNNFLKLMDLTNKNQDECVR